MDIAAAVIAVGAAAVLYFGGVLEPGGEGGSAVIYVDREPIVRLPLKDDITYTVETENGYNVVTIENGMVGVSDSDCRDKICVNHKDINSVNESIVCLPHKMVIEIEGGEQSSVDAVAQ